MLSTDQRMCWFYFVSILSSQVDYLPSPSVYLKRLNLTQSVTQDPWFCSTQTQEGDEKAKQREFISSLLPLCSELHFCRRPYASKAKPHSTPVLRTLFKDFSFHYFIIISSLSFRVRDDNNFPYLNFHKEFPNFNHCCDSLWTGFFFLTGLTYRGCDYLLK